MRVTKDGIPEQRTEEKPLGGTFTDYTITLTDADTSYQVPASGNVPTKPYVLILGNTSDTNILWKTANDATGGHTIISETGEATFRLAANKVLYARCASAGKILNYSTMEVEA